MCFFSFSDSTFPGALIGLNCFNSLAKSCLFYHIMRFGTSIRVAVTGLVYRKVRAVPVTSRCVPSVHNRAVKAGFLFLLCFVYIRWAAYHLKLVGRRKCQALKNLYHYLLIIYLETLECKEKKSGSAQKPNLMMRKESSRWRGKITRPFASFQELLPVCFFSSQRFTATYFSPWQEWAQP